MRPDSDTLPERVVVMRAELNQVPYKGELLYVLALDIRRSTVESRTDSARVHCVMPFMLREELCTGGLHETSASTTTSR